MRFRCIGMVIGVAMRVGACVRSVVHICGKVGRCEVADAIPHDILHTITCLLRPVRLDVPLM